MSQSSEAVAIATIGHNGGPELTPFECDQRTITDLYDEAKQWLDGEPVTTQAQADAINTLKAAIKAATKTADDNRKAAQEPFKAEIDAIQEAYNALIGKNKSITGLAIKAEEACNAALNPYLIELDRQQQEAARIAREEAERKQREAMEAMRQSDAANLAEREEAERLVQEAKSADENARKAEKAKAHARGDGRATGLRTVYRAEMYDLKAAAAWVWAERREELRDFVQKQANEAVRGGLRHVPGFNVNEEKTL